MPDNDPSRPPFCGITTEAIKAIMRGLAVLVAIALAAWLISGGFDPSPIIAILKAIKV
ncbi:hypothetical protein ACIBH1_45800 [Nonomuraea sp. NPDC050663]|uniref:hypothetical protein n=1 Tax=Nonomuraea sp. NPDC050663 TaxID=3364370 RepID=UPI0037B2751C